MDTGPRRMKGLAKASLRATPHSRGGQVIGSELEARLFEVVEVISEGRFSEEDQVYQGSTMLTFCLDELTDESMDDAACQALLSAVEGSVRVRARASRMARAEALDRFPDREPGTAQIETAVRLDGKKLHLDVDLELPVDKVGKKSASE